MKGVTACLLALPAVATAFSPAFQPSKSATIALRTRRATPLRAVALPSDATKADERGPLAEQVRPTVPTSHRISTLVQGSAGCLAGARGGRRMLVGNESSVKSRASTNGMANTVGRSVDCPKAPPLPR